MSKKLNWMYNGKFLEEQVFDKDSQILAIFTHFSFLKIYLFERQHYRTYERKREKEMQILPPLVDPSHGHRWPHNSHVWATAMPWARILNGVSTPVGAGIQTLGLSCTTFVQAISREQDWCWSNLVYKWARKWDNTVGCSIYHITREISVNIMSCTSSWGSCILQVSLYGLF